MNNREIRIGILTLSASDNCGSLLQSYGLQKKLVDLGYENVEIINFKSDISKRAYDIFPKDIFLQPRKLVFSILNYAKLKKQKNDYNLYRKEYLFLSKEKYKDSADIKNISSYYDVVICGSDQVWNVCMYDFNEAFFLPNVNNIKKIAYAASLGGKSLYKYHDTDELKRWIGDFNSVSVREAESRDEVSLFYGGDVEILADPTLLIDREEWVRIAGTKRLVDENYIFYYSWSYNNQKLIQKVREISEKLGKTVYVINASKWLYHSYKKYGFKLCKEGGPLAFLNLIYYSDLVFVESLHGTIFATIFQKNFWYLNDHENGEIDLRNKYFLKLLNMSNRVIGVNEDYCIKKILESIDYSIDNKVLEEIKIKSVDWLEKSIE